MKKILFVCTGNICRSPMGEALFRLRMGDTPDWTAASAGTFADTGNAASSNAVAAMMEMNVDIRSHRSQPITGGLLSASDLIVTMTEGHRSAIVQEFPEVANRVFLLKSFGTSKVPADISDPYGGSMKIYREIRDEIDRALSDLILFIRSEK